MKNILLIGALFLMLSVPFSCSNFLNEVPFSEISESQFEDKSKLADLLLIGCYNGMQGALHNEWALTELRSDNARINTRISSTSTFNNIFLLDVGSTISLDPFVTEYWVLNYKNIARCNNAIMHYTTLNDSTKIRNISEARFIRAYHYFNLLRLYGGVFLSTEPTTTDDVETSRYTERSSVDDVLYFVEKELETITNNNYLPKSYADVDKGRITDLAARSLLAKIYLHHYSPGTDKYNAAIPLLKQVITDGGNPQSYTDLVAYNNIFSVNNEMNKEIIFAIRYKSGNLGLGSPFANEFAPSNSGLSVINGQGLSYNYPTNSIISAFEAGDLRKNVALAEGYTKSTGEYISDDGTGTYGNSRYIKKFLSQVTVPYDAENDFPIIRMGDVLLLYCEAVNESQGVTSEIINYYNMIRQRAGLNPKTTAEITNSFDFRQLIRQERRVELAFENQRWFDLLRWGNTSQFLNTTFIQDEIYKVAGYSPNFSLEAILLPIPSIVLDINPNIPQNLGY